jgi:ankyrin repeat protein
MPLNIVWKDIELAKILVQYGADPAKGPKSGIISATELGAVELLKFFLEESLDCNEVDRSPSTSRTYGWDRHSDSITINPLLIAALPWKDDIHNVSVEMTQLLMKHGAKLDVKISEAQTLLHYIMENLTDPDIFAPFLESKTVDFGLRDQNGLTAFMAACKPPHNDQKFQGTKAKSILIASSNSHGSTIDYQAVDNDGNHVLMHLIPGWTSELSDFFLNKPEIQAVINQKNKKGFSPFHYALLHDKYFACHTFLAAGADITDPDPDGNSALHYICKPNCRGSFTAGISLFKNYLDCGGSIDARNANGETPLIVFVGKSIYAEYCREGREEHIPLFSSHGANFNVARNDGRTALHIVAADPWSSFAGAAVLFKALVECGADPLQEDGEGRTALDLAAAVGNANILEMYQRPGQRGAEGMRTSAVIRRRRTRETSRTMLAL